MFKVSRALRVVSFTALALSLSTGAALAKGKVKAKKFDFAKTKAFVCEVDTRPDFPVSLPLAGYYTYSLLATGNSVEPAKKTALIGYIKKSQQKNGGFVSDKADKSASMLQTDLALETLGYLKSTNAIDTARVKSFVASLKNADGGFGFSQEAKGSSLATTFFAVRTLKAVGGMDLIDKAKTAAYLKQFEKKEGGFGFVKGTGVANAKNTYMAVATLDTLGLLDQATAKNSVKFLGTTPYVKGKSNKVPELDEQLYAVKALKMLKAAERIDKKFALVFLKSIYLEVNGGFGPMHGYGSAPESTAAALEILSEIGALKGSGVTVAAK
jgi:prenyltransferase beta subunit